MTLRLVVVRKARSQLISADRWWRENRSDPDLLEREIAAAAALLTEHPEAGAPFLLARQQGVRRILLRRTQYHLYYRIDDHRGFLRILALWHTARGRGPQI